MLVQADRLLLGAEDTPADPATAALVYLEAVGQGSSEGAVRAAVLAALGVGRAKNWTEALDLLAQGAELGSRSARRQVALLAGRGGRLALGEAGSVALWRRVRAEIDIEELMTPPPTQWISESPAIGVVKNFIPAALAAWFIRRANNRLEHGHVNDANSGEVRIHPMRSAGCFAFTLLQRDIVVALVQERAARLTSLPVHQHEPPNVISYQPGQQFEPHYDFIDPLV